VLNIVMPNANLTPPGNYMRAAGDSEHNSGRETKHLSRP
jgi:hypothetical protein